MFCIWCLVALIQWIFCFWSDQLVHACVSECLLSKLVSACFIHVQRVIGACELCGMSVSFLSCMSLLLLSFGLLILSRSWLVDVV
jgi:hypothetical protein